jgi:hypothetical protein
MAAKRLVVAGGSGFLGSLHLATPDAYGPMNRVLT